MWLLHLRLISLFMLNVIMSNYSQKCISSCKGIKGIGNGLINIMWIGSIEDLMMHVLCCSMIQDVVDYMPLDIYSSIRTSSISIKRREESVLPLPSSEMKHKVGLFYLSSRLLVLYCLSLSFFINAISNKSLHNLIVLNSKDLSLNRKHPFCQESSKVLQIKM